MGAWDSDPFGNDTACDWIYQVEKSNDLTVIASTLDKALSSGDDYLEAPMGEEALAAADTVARLRGHFYVRNSYTASLDQWVARQTIPAPDLLAKRAIAAIDRILKAPSELLELWAEAGSKEWREHLDALKKRLLEPAVGR